MPKPEIAAFLDALGETQYLAPERLQAYQRRLLEGLLRHARDETAFYRDRLSPVMRGDGGFDWSRWNEIPILKREDARERFDALVARSVPKAAGPSIEDVSSGSTGRPVRHLRSTLQDLASGCCSERFFGWHGIDPGSLTVRIRASDHGDALLPDGHRLAGWRPGHEESVAIDLAIGTPVDRQVRFLERVRPRYLISYPSNLRAIAETMAAARSGTAGAPVFDAVMSYGEMVTPDTRRAIEEGFGVRLLDRYGAAEAGHISAACPHSLKHHIASELVLVELLDAAGSPVPPGEEGRVIVTPFYNLAMPLIRYEIGDHAILSEAPCGCGRSLPLFERILGRTRNMFRLSGGRTVWPVLFSHDFNHFVPNRQFQWVQVEPELIELRYVPVARGQVNDVDGLAGYVRRQLDADVKVTVREVDRIARSQGGKYEDYLCLVPESRDQGGD